MSIRFIVLTLVVLFLTGYAWKNWFNALVGAIVLFAFLEHPDMPRKMLGIPGLNYWNLLFASITFAWLQQRVDEGNEWDLPGLFKFLMIGYLSILIISFARAFIDPGPFCNESRMSLLLNYLVNSLKFLLPALLLYDGCRTRERVTIAVAALMLVYFFLSILTIKSMGIHLNFSSGDELSAKAARRLTRDVGYHRVDLSMMLAGGSLAMFAFSRLIKSWPLQLGCIGASAIILLGQAVTGGRTGYVSWALIGLMLSVLRWRKLLPLIPLAIVLVLAFVPAVRERMFQGFAGKKGAYVEQTDTSSITSGRTDVWPYVIEEIGKSPVVGYGRLAMQRTGLTAFARDFLNDEFAHPHNAYLEYLLDNGVLGFLVGMPVYGFMIYVALSLFRDRSDPTYEVVGAACFALIMALLLAAVGAQTFYPREGVVPMWAMFGIALRLFVLRNQTYDEDVPVFREEEDPPALLFSRLITAKDAEDAEVLRDEFHE